MTLIRFYHPWVGRQKDAMELDPSGIVDGGSLFGDGESAAEEGQVAAEAGEGSFPSYVYMSDQFRLKKPPELVHWQQNFLYLQVTGSKLFEGESMEHIQAVPTEVKAVSGEGGECELLVEGHSCLEEPTQESRAVTPREYGRRDKRRSGSWESVALQCSRGGGTGRTSEGVLLVDGGSTGKLVYDAQRLSACSWTYSSRYSAVQLTSFYKAMLEKQQQTVRTAREEREAAANRTIKEQIAFEKAQQLKLEQEVLEEAARVEALEQQRQEEERREVERRELLLKQQLEENDEEEVKIKTLAYSHTREWHQPNKKCFSHRGRQL
ncbi:hypothetical protein ON010_g15385 [Phytophthora cinnamomi]|nr:hypothetical protein ON010_g15385 [Phytophthora cinnamomi]